MKRKTFEDDIVESIEEMGYVAHLHNIPRQKKSGKRAAIRPRPEPSAGPLTESALKDSALINSEDEKFQMSYKASRHEAIWLEESLQNFFHQKWFDDVLRMIKGGKEASVYLCQGNHSTGVDLLAAKVYRPRRFRSLKNDWLYREGRTDLDDSGRQITNKGMLHAMQKRTDYGRELLHTSWLEHEFQTLVALHEAGGDVPRPFASDANAILMEYFGDQVMGAPTLNDVDLTSGEAYTLFERVIHNIDLMLKVGCIHGDLSAFNILFWEDQIVLIDFPQVVRPGENRSAYPIFERDVTRVCEYFRRQGVRSNPRKLAVDLWQRHHQSFALPFDPKILGEDRDDERDLWESLKNA